MNTMQDQATIEAAIQKLQGQLSELRAMLRNLKQRKHNNRESDSCRLTKRIVTLVLNGEQISDAAKQVGLSIPPTRSRLFLFCERVNPTVYANGIRHGESNSYKTPPLQYLRDNKHHFLTGQTK
jgi:hypothetical protein